MASFTSWGCDALHTILFHKRENIRYHIIPSRLQLFLCSASIAHSFPVIPGSKRVSLLSWVGALAPGRIKPWIVMSTRTSSISSQLYRAGILKYLVLSRNGLCTFYLQSFPGSERSLSSQRSSLALCTDQLKILCKISRHNCWQNPHDWERVEDGKKG